MYPVNFLEKSELSLIRAQYCIKIIRVIIRDDCITYKLGEKGAIIKFINFVKYNILSAPLENLALFQGK